MRAIHLARAAWAAAACFVVLGGARAQASVIPGAADRVLALVNQERARAGLAPVTMDPQLNTAAQNFADYMGSANFYAHNGPDGSTPLSRMNAAGFPGTGAWGENIAAGQSDAESVMQAWMNSPGHRSNILNPSFTHIGIGAAHVPGSQWRYYWAQSFGVRRGGAGAGSPGGTPAPQPQPWPQPTPQPTPQPAPQPYPQPVPQPYPQPTPQPAPQPTPQPQMRGPSLAYITPARGAVGDTVTLVGQNFGATPGSVSFSGTVARLLSWTNTQIQVQVPAGASSGAVYVQNSAGTSVGVSFSVVANTPPPAPRPAAAQADYLYPTSARAGDRVTIYGRGFGASGGQVMVNGVRAQVAFWYDTIISFTVPTGATSGPVLVQSPGGAARAGSLTIITAEPIAAPAPAPTPAPTTGGHGSSNGNPAPAPAPVLKPNTGRPTPSAQKPTVRSIDVAVGATSRTVTIHGSGFGAQSGRVRLSGTALTVLSWSDTSITVQVPLRKKGKSKKLKLDVSRPDGSRSKQFKVRL